MKVYVDSADKAKKDWKAALGPDEFVGQVEIPGALGRGLRRDDRRWTRNEVRK